MFTLTQDHPRWLAPVTFLLTIACAMLLSQAPRTVPGSMPGPSQALNAAP